MKKCKYCQTEIDKKAKICPNCHKKQSHIVRWILLGLLAIIVVGVITGGSGEDNKFQKEYNQNDMVTYKDVNYSIIDVDKTKGSNQYFQAKDGYEFVKWSDDESGHQYGSTREVIAGYPLKDPTTYEAVFRKKTLFMLDSIKLYPEIIEELDGRGEPVFMSITGL